MINTKLALAPKTDLQLSEVEIPLPPAEQQQCHLEQWIELAFNYSPQLKQGHFEFMQAENKICQTKSEKLPTVNFYANAGHSYVYNHIAQNTIAETGVSLNWNLYDPTNRPRLKQAKEAKMEAASKYFQLELDVETAIYDFLNEIEKSQLAFQLAQEGAILAEEGMKMATKKHQLGMMSAFEYREAIKTHHEALQQVNQAKFDLRNAYDRLIQQAGIDLR